MKRRFLFLGLSLFTILSLVLGVASPLLPRTYAADPTNNNFTFYVPNGGDYLTQLKTALDAVNITDSSRGQTGVYVTGGVFGKNTVTMTYNPDQTGCAEGEGGPVGLSSCDGQFGGANDNLSVYTLEYNCDTSKNGLDLAPSALFYDPSQNDSNAHYDIKMSVSLSLADYHNQPGSGLGLFTSDGANAQLQPSVVMHWAGFSGIKRYYDSLPGTTTPPPTVVSSEQIPAACRPLYENSKVYSSSTDDGGNDGSIVDETVKVTSTLPAGVSAPTGTPGGTTQTSVSCDSSGFVLSWIICPVIDGAQSAINGIYRNFIQPLLKIDSHQLLDPSQGYYKAWSTFRIYADIVLVIILLIIVFGESIGGGA